MNYETVIIGAGLSGLAAGIRLAHFKKRVLILEAHNLCGGLNSFFRREGRLLDVGLHAMTNFVPPGTRRAPLTKLLRQLRIRYEELELVPQGVSRIEFPSCTLTFSNDFDMLRGEVAEKFPSHAEEFDRLAQRIEDYDDVRLDPPELSARQELSRFLSEPLLIEMLLAPLMYYGNAAEGDMDFTQFAILWKSIFRSGFARPERGMRAVIHLLRDRYLDAGGELRMGSAVEELRIDAGRVAAIRLEGGEEIHADTVLSSAGYVETMRLCSGQPADALEDRVGRLSFVELIAVLDGPACAPEADASIIFFNNDDVFTYGRPEDSVDMSSGVVCCPDGFLYPRPAREGMVRVTAKASYPRWKALAGAVNRRDYAAEYGEAKQAATRELLREASRRLPDFRGRVVFTDLFTPLTIERFTRHLAGAVYGSPVKSRQGLTPVENLFVCGTDQGFLGIVGSMLSGISMANYHCLS